MSLDELIEQSISTLTEFAISLAIAVAVFYIGKFIIKKLYNVVLSILLRRNVDQSLSTFILSFVKIVLYFILIVTVIGILGIETTSFLALFASAGVAIGMALSGNLSNFAGGIIILAFRPYKVGDFIESGTGAAGTVKEIQIFHTILTTPDNKIVYAPNGPMSTSIVTNYSRLDTRRVDFTFGVEYGTDFKQVRDILMEIIAADARILPTPEPFVELGALADSSVNVTVRVWVKSADYWAVNFDMNKNVYAVFNEKGISFPFPQITVHQA